MRKYSSIQGDTWDGIALKVLGNEKYMSDLIAANAELAGLVVFPAGVVVKVPELEEEYEAGKLPPWKE